MITLINGWSLDVELDVDVTDDPIHVSGTYMTGNFATGRPVGLDPLPFGITVSTAGDAEVIAEPTDTNRTQVKEMTIHNADSVEHTVKVKLNAGGTVGSFVKVSKLLQPNSSIVYANGVWSVFPEPLASSGSGGGSEGSYFDPVYFG